jgi:tungstate transport system substrate-binding protein
VLPAVTIAGCGGGGDRLIVAAGTTLVDSGVMDEMAEAYEEYQPGVEVSIVGRATQEVLDLGSRGAADLLITHAPALERDFVAGHPGASAVAVFASRFLLVGPPDRSASLDGMTVVEALHKISDEGWAFVTRADRSGTHERERALWQGAGLVPDGASWYDETGQGMGFSLQVADQKGAFILVEQGTLLAGAGVLRLRPARLVQSEQELANPYTAILPNAEEPGEAARFLDWLLSPGGRAALAAANDEIFGTVVFEPDLSR